MSSYNLPCVTQSLFHIYTLCCFWLTRGTGEFFKGKAKRCFRDWPFVYFSGGFISHLFGDYANINLWNQIIWRLEILLRTIVAALLKTKCNGRFVMNKRYQKAGKEYFRRVQMIVKDEGYKYFPARATFDAWSCPPSPPSVPQTRHTHQQKGHFLPDDLCPSHLQPTQPYFQFPSRQMHKFSYQLPK